MNKTEYLRQTILSMTVSNIVFIFAVYIANSVFFHGSLGWAILLAYGIWIGFTLAAWVLRTVSQTVIYYIEKKRNIRNFVTALHKNKIKIYEAVDIDFWDARQIFSHIIKNEQDIDRDAYLFVTAASFFHDFLLAQQQYAAAFRAAMIQDEAYRQYKHEVYTQSLNDRIVPDPNED